MGESVNEQSRTATARADPDRTWVLAEGICAGVPLWPPLRPREPPARRMHVDYIAHQHPEVSTYRATLQLMTGDALFIGIGSGNG